jgi:hypothetical protein
VPEDLADLTLAPAPEEATEENERHLRAVEPRRRPRPRYGLWLSTAVTVASVFLLVAFNVFMVQGQFTLDRISQDRSIEQQHYEDLRLQVAELSAPETIVDKAFRLGLVNGAMPQFIEAPAAAPTKPAHDPTSRTLKDSWDTAKKALAANP